MTAILKVWEVVDLFVPSKAVTTCKTLPVAIAPGKAVTAPKDALATLPWGIVPVKKFAASILLNAIIYAPIILYAPNLDVAPDTKFSSPSLFPAINTLKSI